MNRIIYTNTEGNVSVVIPSPEWTGTMQELLAKLQSRGDIHATDTPEVCHHSDIPADRTLRNAWKRGEQGKKVGHDMVKAKDIAHGKRRAKRDEEFAPHDDIIAKQIPGKDLQAAEAARTAIRTKYDAMQTEMDACADPDSLIAIINREGL